METLRRNPIYYIVFAIALILTVVRISFVIASPRVDYRFDSSKLHCNSEEQIYSIELVSLDKGIYEIMLEYEASDGGFTNVYCDVHSHKTLYTDNPELSAYENSIRFNVWVNDAVESLVVEAKPNGGNLSVHKITVSTSSNSKVYGIVCALLPLFLLSGILLAIKYRDRYQKYGLRIFLLLLIMIISSWGVFIRYLIPGHDMVFHMLRIEGIKDAILLGDIPAKVQTNWNFGYGYAVSAMYADTTLIIPAIMRLLGFTVQTTYKTFIVIINIATTLCAYFCFRKMSKKDASALLGTFLYVCAPYRLINIYNRAAVGEYTAMLFLPLVVLGFYYAYAYDDSTREYGKKYLVPVIGFSGLIQCHLLTCVMTSIFIFVFCIVKWRKTFSKNRFMYLLKIAGLTILVNLWFIIPLIRFANEPLLVSLKEEMAADLQSYGLSIPEIFAQYSSGYHWYNFAFYTSLSERNTMSLGNGIAILLLLFIALKSLNKLGKKTRTVTLFAVLTVVCIWMSSNLFPYSLINKICEPLALYLTKVQFPYRYLLMAILFGTLFAIALYDKIIKKLSKNAVMIITVAVVLITASQSFNHMYALFYNGTCSANYDSASLYSAEVIGGQYLYQNTDINQCRSQNKAVTDNVTLNSYERNRNRFLISCCSDVSGGTVLLPLFAYPGYEAKDENGQLLKTNRGNNNRLEICVPSSFYGKITVSYKEDILWRICEAVSILGIVLVVYLDLRRRRNTTDEEIHGIIVEGER